MNLFRVVTLMIFSLGIVSCDKEQEILENDSASESFEMTSRRGGKGKPRPPLNIPIYKEDRLIIQYKDGISAAEKELVRDLYKDEYGEFENRVCALCVDESIEMWIFQDLDGIEIKNVSLGIQGGSGGVEGEIENVDYEFEFTLEA
ncbi:MAG: hypothetical protein HRT68_05400 [Flavobacteriaceae bacterium]|nr:hypothetical protein [Flavobacteriaceae bacterium]